MKTISRRGFLTQHISGWAAFFLSSFGAAFSSPKTGYRRVIIIYSYGLGAMPLSDFNLQSTKDRIGLLLVRARWVDSIRSEGHAVIYIDGGDLIGSGFELDCINQTPEILLLKKLNCDAVIPGESELALGIDRWGKIAAENNLTWLASNYLINSPPLQHYVKPFVVLNCGGFRIGVTGLAAAGREKVTTEDATKIEFMDSLRSLNSAGAQLKRQGCDWVIGFVHDRNEFSEVAGRKKIEMTELENIDLVIGCHGRNYFRSPRLYTNKSGKNILYVQLLGQENYLGRIDLFLPEKGGNKTLSFNEIIEVKKL